MRSVVLVGIFAWALGGIGQAADEPKLVELLKKMDVFRKEVPPSQGIGEVNGFGLKDVDGKHFLFSHLRGVAIRLGVKSRSECMALLTYLNDRDPKMRIIAAEAIENVVHAYPDGFPTGDVLATDSDRHELVQRHRELSLRFVDKIEKLPAEPGAAPEKETATEGIGRLIRQLGDNAYAKREAASKELCAIGAPALAALWKAAESSVDAEIRRRAEDIAAIVTAKAEFLIESSLKPGMLLEVKDAKAEGYTPIQLAGPGNQPNRRWRLIHIGNGEYLIESALKKGVVLDVKDAKAEKGALIQLGSDAYQPGGQRENRRWKLSRTGENGECCIESVLKERLVLEVTDGKAENDTPIQLGEAGKEARQLWRLIPMDMGK
jgi:hypothetical protein